MLQRAKKKTPNNSTSLTFSADRVARVLSATDEHLRPNTMPPLPSQDFLEVFLAPHPEVLVAAVRCVQHPGYYLLGDEGRREAGGGGGALC